MNLCVHTYHSFTGSLCDTLGGAKSFHIDSAPSPNLEKKYLKGLKHVKSLKILCSKPCQHDG